ncbi:MAG TPA: sugar ABC transporter permease, partial [Acidimicrobiales bacterium]|nr:sugar ABC transporter permease [Acidimicrobiales bacterium]
MASVTTVERPEAGGVRPQAKGPRGSRLRWRNNATLAALLFLLPAALVILGLLAYPLGLGIWLSLTNQSVGTTGHFVGLANFKALATDPIFQTAVFNTVLYTVVSIVFKYVLGMGLALLLNRRFRFNGLARGVVLLPWVAPTVLTAMAWWWIFDPQFSIISWML